VNVKLCPDTPAFAVVGLTTIVPAPFAAAVTTLTVGWLEMLVSVPPDPLLVCVVKVALPVVAGAVTPENVNEKESPFAHA
jgi:hypothetical protein